MESFLSSESAQALFPLFFFVIILVIVYFAFRRQHETIKKTLEQQALKRNGTVKKWTFLSFPRLNIILENLEVSVYSKPGGRNSPPHTFVEADLNTLRDYKIKILRELRIFGIGTVFGQDVQINNPEFDEAFLIQGSDEMILRSFLTSDIQSLLLRMKEYSPVFEIQKKKFKFYIPRIPKDEREYDVLIDAGLALIRKAQELE